MRAVAVALTFGRVELSELLAQLARQTTAPHVPTLLYVDDCPDLEVTCPEGVYVARGGPIDGVDYAVGILRRRAVEAARERFSLTRDDVIIVLDDDDFYASGHFEYTLRAMRGGVQWTGALSIGLETEMGDRLLLEHVRNEAGCGQHGTWAFTLGLYDTAGGYLDAPDTDVALSLDMGRISPCQPHTYCTHVRRHHGANMSRLKTTRAELRLRTHRAMVAAPRWSDLCEERERFCSAYLLG